MGEMQTYGIWENTTELDIVLLYVQRACWIMVRSPPIPGVPGWISENRKYSREWIRGFFDSEGCIGKRHIAVQSVNPEGLGQVKKMLEQFGIDTTEYKYKRKNPNYKINYHLIICNKKSRYNFLKRIGLNHTERLRKLVAQLADVA
ncbi:MAG: LAGLIDADG family homing endonuclease [Candidatus Micrarchaeia archaeon]